MKHWTTSAMIVMALAAMSHGALAQGGDKMAKPMDAMGKGKSKSKTYTGCIEAGASAGTYTLTHAMADMHMGKDAMSKDAMKKDGMAKEGMAPANLMLHSTSVDLSKHVGHKVSVTGAEGAMGKGMAKPDAMAKPGEMDASMPMLTISSIKMIAATCTM